MLSAMRSALGGWIAKIFLFLLVASFAVWGVSGSMFGGVGNAVVTVGETKVGLNDYRLAYERQLALYQRQLGTRLTREQADALGLSQGVLAQIVSAALLDESAREMNLGLSDDKLAGLIAEDEAFQDASGRFSRAQLRQALRSIGMPEEDYIENRKQVAIRDQIIEGAAASTALPDAYWEILAAFQSERRKFRYATLDARHIGDLPAPDDAAIEAFYQANLDRYEAPEYRELVIVKLEAEDIADPAALTDEDVAADYETRKSSFSTPEKRRIQQLVFADRAAAEAAAEKLAGGESFETVVRETGRSENDIDLGLLAKTDIPDQTIADAAFDLPLNGTSGVIDGVFGPVILRVTEIQPEKTRPLAEVEAEIREALALETAAEEIFDTHDRLEDERAAGENLADAARAVGLEPRRIEAVDRAARRPDGTVIDDIPQSASVLSEAFEIDPGVETAPISIGMDGFVWVEVLEVIPERQKPLEEVRSAVIEDWRAEQEDDAVTALAEGIRDAVAEGAELAAAIERLVTGEIKPEIKESVPLLRSDTSRDLGEAAVAAGFAIPEGGVTTADAPVDETAAADEQRAAKVVLEVAEVIAGSDANVDATTRERLNTALGDDLVNQMIARLQENHEVEINQRAIQAALSQ